MAGDTICRIASTTIARVLQGRRLGFRDVGPHPAHAPRPSVGSYGWPGYHGTVWYNDPAEDMTTIFLHAARARGRSEVADVERLLDDCVPGDRRLNAAAKTAEQAEQTAVVRRPAEVVIVRPA
jgi:CubicO group peptidase (beta-lactamase class C family)